MEAIDLTKILKEEHQGKWVVYSPSKLEIFAFDEDPIKAAEKAKKIPGDGDRRLMKVLPYNQTFAPIA